MSSQEQKAKWAKSLTETKERIENRLKMLFELQKSTENIADIINLYINHVDEYIDIIRRQRKWELVLLEPNLLEKEEARKLPDYMDGDVCYRFPEEALNVSIREFVCDYFTDDGFSLVDYLSHRECYISFDEHDLIIRWNKYPQDEDDDVIILGSEQFQLTSDLPSSFVGIDFETLYSQRVSACAVGMVKFKDGTVVDRYYSLIKPPFEYPGKSGVALTWIHGFTESMLEGERTFDAVLPEIEAFAEGLPLVAHNACVERNCILEASAFYGLNTKLDVYSIIDTLPLSRQIEAELGVEISGPGTHVLDAVCKRFKVNTLHHHNALDDAEMCGNLLTVFNKIRSQRSGFTLAETQFIDDVKNMSKKINTEDKVQRDDLENVADNPFKNKVIVLTGFSCSTSQDYGHRLNRLGAIVKEGVTKKTQILITGPNAGPSKISKCIELGAKIVSESEFLTELSNFE